MNTGTRSMRRWAAIPLLLLAGCDSELQNAEDAYLAADIERHRALAAKIRNADRVKAAVAEARQRLDRAVTLADHDLDRQLTAIAGKDRERRAGVYRIALWERGRLVAKKREVSTAELLDLCLGSRTHDLSTVVESYRRLRLSGLDHREAAARVVSKSAALPVGSGAE